MGYIYDAAREPHMLFIGRWCPLHRGHVAIIEKKVKENPGCPVLIYVRQTSFDTLSADIRAKLVKIWMEENGIEGLVVTAPDIKGVYYGRGVGYEIEEVEVSEEVQAISATEIRRRIKMGDDSWKELIASPEVAAYLECLLDDESN
jgi:nicotinic acid mononucleotide adenylyltransferase